VETVADELRVTEPTIRSANRTDCTPAPLPAVDINALLEIHEDCSRFFASEQVVLLRQLRDAPRHIRHRRFPSASFVASSWRSNSLRMSFRLYSSSRR
jgi:hypothetical protein